MAEIKRIFLTGAPGSRWSKIDRYIRACTGFKSDNTDINEKRNWKGHRGAYWNPGNEPGFDWILNFNSYTKEHIVETLDSVFSPIPEVVNTIVRVHKSHHFAYHLDKIRELFPDDAIVMVSQPSHLCLLWWEICGGHDTVFDSYHYYKRDYDLIWDQIVTQNTAIDNFIEKNNLEKNYINLTVLEKYFGPLNPRFIEKFKKPRYMKHEDFDSLLTITEPDWYQLYGTGLEIDHKISIVPWKEHRN